MKILVDNMPDRPQQCLCANRRSIDGWVCMFTHRVCEDTSKCRYLKEQKGQIYIGSSEFASKKELKDVESTKIHPCHCGSEQYRICKVGNTFAALYYIRCNACENESEQFPSIKEAIDDWNDEFEDMLVDTTDEEIKNLLPETERLCQLAEEASELTQAALKLRRVMDGTNPTPKTYDEAKANLVEEVADIMCVVDLLLEDNDYIKIDKIIEAKKKRWIGRIKEARGDSDASIR